MIKPEEISDEIREVSEILENEICDFLGIKDEDDGSDRKVDYCVDGDDVPF